MPLEQMPPLLIIAVAIAAVALLVAASRQRRRSKASACRCMLLVGALTVDRAAHRAVRGCASACLKLAALLTVVLVWQTARSHAAKFTYLAVVLISAGSMIASDLLADRGALDWARALLLTSVCVKLAAVPLFFWLLALADEVPALVLGLIIAVVDMAAFGEFYVAAQAFPSLLTPQPLLVYAAALTSLARRTADAHAAQPQAAAGSLDGRRRGLPAARRRLGQRTRNRRAR